MARLGKAKTPTVLRYDTIFYVFLCFWCNQDVHVINHVNWTCMVILMSLTLPTCLFSSENLNLLYLGNVWSNRNNSDIFDRRGYKQPLFISFIIKA